MVGHPFPIVDAVAVVKDNKEHVVILDIGGSTYYQRIAHHEFLLNSHYIRYNGVVVEDTARKYGGKQCLIILYEIGNTTILLVFDGDILKMNLLQPI